LQTGGISALALINKGFDVYLDDQRQRIPEHRRERGSAWREHPAACERPGALVNPRVLIRLQAGAPDE
jgi:hypothetical protein